MRARHFAGALLAGAVLIATGCQSTHTSNSQADGTAASGTKTPAVQANPQPSQWGRTGGVYQPSAEPVARPAPAPRVERCAWPKGTGDMAWTMLAYPTGDARTSALGVEKGVPRQARLNQAFDYKIIVTNLTGMTLQSVVVNETPGEHLTVNSASPSSTTARNGTYSWAIGTLAPCESRTITVNATATKEGTVGSCLTATYSNELCATIPVVEPRLTITKTGPAQVLQCDPINYVITVRNTGTGAVDGVVVTDPLPAGLTAGGERNLRMDVGTLAPGESKQFPVVAMASRTGQFTNAASVRGEGGLNAASENVVTKVVKPVLEITKTGPATRFIGLNSTYEITVTNTGDAPARDAIVSDALPTGAVFVRASGGGTLSGSTVQWNAGTIAPNASRSYTVVYSGAIPGTLCNTASASAYCAETVTARACTEYEGIPAILLEVVDEPDPIEVGGTTTYTITATNQGSALDTNVVITCTLPAGQAYVGAEGATQGRLAGNTLTFAPLPRLAPKERATWRVTVRATETASVRFRVTMDSDQLVGDEVLETEATNQYE